MDNRADPEWDLTFVVDLSDDWLKIASLGKAGGKFGLEVEVYVYDEAILSDDALGNIIFEIPITTGVAEPISSHLGGAGSGAQGHITVSFYKPKETPLKNTL